MADFKNQKNNTYKFTITVAGQRFSTKEADVITYTETCDYINNTYPIRVLSISAISSKFYAIIKGGDPGNVKHFYDMDVTITPSNSGGINKLPLSDGVFKAQIISLPDKFNFGTLNKSKGEDSVSQSDQDTVVEIQFYLFRENELTLQNAPFISGVFASASNSNLLKKCFKAINTVSGMKVICSTFPTKELGFLILPNTSVLDVIKLLDDEVGFFKTNYTIFTEHNILFFINLDNDIGVEFPDLTYYFDISTAREAEDNKGELVASEGDNRYYNYSVDKSAYEKTKNTNSTFVDNIEYITPSGKKFYNKPSNTRKVRVVRKITESEPTYKYTDKVTETIDFDLTGVGLNFFTPMTVVTFTDGFGTNSKYRIYYKEITCSGNNAPDTKLKVFRLLDSN